MTASGGTANKLPLGFMKCQRSEGIYSQYPTTQAFRTLNTELTCGSYKDTSESEHRESCQLRFLCRYISTFFNKWAQYLKSTEQDLIMSDTLYFMMHKMIWTISLVLEYQLKLYCIVHLWSLSKMLFLIRFSLILAKISIKCIDN